MQRKEKQKRWIIYVLICAVALVTIGLIGNVIVRSTIQKKISAALKQFDPYIQTHFSSIHVNLFEATIALDSFAVFYRPQVQEQHGHSIYFPSFAIRGINFFKLISG